MRCADPGDSEDIAQIQEMFFVELSKYSEFKTRDLCLQGCAGETVLYVLGH